MRFWVDVAYGLCHCGCGGKTTICKQTQTKMGHVAGEPFHYLRGHATKESNESRFLRNFEKAKGDACWLWMGKPDAYGYGVISNKVKAHRFSYEYHYGPFDKKLDVLHRCDSPGCVRPDHLFLGTQADNNRDMWSKGRGHIPDTRGENHPTAVLKESEVRRIKKLIKKGMRQQDIAEMFKVSKSCIGFISSGRNWKHIRED